MNVFELIWFMPLQFEKMPRFVEFSKNLPLEYIGQEKEADYSKYERMYKNGLISKEDFQILVSEEEEKRIEESRKSVKAVKTKNGYIIHTKQPTDIIAILHTTAQLYFGINADIWEKVEPLFYAVLERNLDMDDENIRVYIELLSDIEEDPIYTYNRILLEKLKRLDEFKNVKDIRDTLGKEKLSKALIEYLGKHIEIVAEGKGKEFTRSKEILKALLSLS